MISNKIRKDIKNNKGITLIALVITIVVLIILAGVAINMTLGENGIFKRAKTAKEMYANAEEYERIQVNSLDSKVDEIAGGSTTPTESEPAYKMPYIPDGFTHTEGEWNNGYTIQNTTTNDEFVWVPCVTNANQIKDGDNVTVFGKTTTGKYNSYYLTDITDQTGAKADAIKASVGTYGGFYIAKYEASSSDGTQNGTARSLPNATPWVNITRANALAKAEAMLPETTDGVKSALISGECWDTTLQWMVNTSDNHSTNAGYDTNSIGKGWYSDNKSNNSTHLTGKSVDTTEATTPNKINNIWDMAGNVYEWTTENCKYNGNVFLFYRGGSCDVSGSSRPAAYRYYYADLADNFVGFRSVLYK